MTDSPLTKLEPPTGGTPSGIPHEQGFFRNPSLSAVFVRVCLYLILGYGITYVLRQLAKFFFGSGRSPYDPQILMTGEVLSLVGVFSAAWMISRLEDRTWGAYGLPSRGAFGKLFWQGVLFGLFEISAVIGSMAALGSYRFGPMAIHGSDLLRWAIFWAVFFLVVGFYEEFSLRGYLQFTLAQGMTFWPAAVALSVIFGALHLGNPGENWVGILGVVLAGLFWCFTLQRTGNLWFAVGMHASFDFGETFLYSVPDSGIVFPGHLSNATFAGPAWITGGTAGPEASVFDFLVLLILFYAFHRMYPARPESTPYPDEARP